MKKKEIRIIEGLPFKKEDTLSLTDMNKVKGGGICFRYSVTIEGDHIVYKCGIKIGKIKNKQ